MTSKSKPTVSADTSGIAADGPSYPMTSASVRNPIDDLEDGINDNLGFLAVSANDTHIKHLEDALSDTGDIAFTVLNDGGAETVKADINAGSVGTAEIAASPSITTPTLVNGATVTGELVVDTSGNAYIKLDGAAGSFREMLFLSGDSTRSALGLGNTAESGSDAGSDFFGNLFTDAGAYKATWLAVTRSTSGITLGDGTLAAGIYVNGVVAASGAKTFEIDHPVTPSTKKLYHAAVESPRLDLMYRGKAVVANGSGTVNIDASSGMTPGTFATLTGGVPQIFAQCEGLYLASVALDGATLSISVHDVAAGAPAADDVTVNWLVIAERNDYNIQQKPMVVERDKEPFEDYEAEITNNVNSRIAAAARYGQDLTAEEIATRLQGEYRHVEGFSYQGIPQAVLDIIDAALAE